MTREGYNGSAIHHPTQPLLMLGGDPGGDTGLALVEFVSRRRDGAPLWINAKLQAFASVGKPERKGASPAELDILHRRHLAETISGMKPSNGYAHIVALEEPLDGAGFYSAQGQGRRQQRRSTAFRLGVHYANLLAATAIATGANRYVSFPAQGREGRRGWMPPKTKRADILQRCDTIIRSIMTPELYRSAYVHGLDDHIRMAVGVINYVVTHYQQIFPPEG
jgi:hypothetical protein